MASEQFSLSWDDFHKNMRSGMNSLLESEDLVDVTLAVEGKYLKAHKMVLSVCSPYFRELFKVTPCNHPIVILKDVSYVAMSDLLQFMYQGEVQVSQENLTTFIKTGEALQIKGLTGDGNGTAEECDTQEEFTKPPEEPKVVHSRTKKVASSPALQPPTAKRQRVIPESTPCSSQTPSNTEPVPQSIQQSPLTDIVQFKMEPFDQTQNSSINHEGHDDNFGDDTLDETNVDDNEDYTMMEAGDEEPQAGPSADGATGEGQVSRRKPPIIKRKSMKIIQGGFAYHNSVIRNVPPVRYLVCANYAKTGCYGRAVLPLNGKLDDLKVTQPHNHPPDFSLEEKNEFYQKLKTLVEQTSESIKLKTIYNSAIKIYPKMANMTPFHSVRTSMMRWRRRTFK